MKRILLLVVVLVFTLFGCKGKNEGNNASSPPDIPTAFSSTVYIVHGEREYEALYTQQSLTQAVLEFTAPATVKGMKIEVDGTECKLSLGSVSFTADFSSLAQSGVGKLIADSVRGASDTSAAVTQKDSDGFVTTGMVSGVSFTLRRSASGLPTRLEVPQAELEVEFRDCTLK